MHEYFQGTVGERIQDLLREKKMTQAVLAQRTQISKATLNRYITDENSRIPHDALLQIARVLGVSTDFLLGATDIPYRTNYDIEELGLTAAAAAKLYTGELNPHIVSQLLENPYFAQMVSEIAAFMEGTESTATATYNGMMKVASKVMYLQGKKHLEDREAAKAALQDMKNHMIPSMRPDMTMIRAAFENLLADLRRPGRMSMFSSGQTLPAVPWRALSGGWKSGRMGWTSRRSPWRISPGLLQNSWWIRGCRMKRRKG